jgi:hypothetical protein
MRRHKLVDGAELAVGGEVAQVVTPDAPVAEILASTVAVVAAIPAEPLKVRRFRVMRERPYVENGMRCIMREGAVVDTATRDVESLRKQGVPLEELAE